MSEFIVQQTRDDIIVPPCIDENGFPFTIFKDEADFL
ncbi:hypothetical protein FHS20_004171 [Phyllobacterium endophyticum]|nr:hypothetical protein [Phyllobacterium endophyticum]